MTYRRDCRRCMELARVDSLHRRSHADSSAYVLSIDLVGHYPIGRDDGRKRKWRYIIVATDPLPLLESEEKHVDVNGGELELADSHAEGDLVLPAEDQPEGRRGETKGWQKKGPLAAPFDPWSWAQAPL